jgi:peptide deformylase
MNKMQIAKIGEAILRQPARKVSHDEFSQAPLMEFCDDLLATMLAANGIGIAAPQVFDPRAIMIIASRPNARYPNAPQMEPLLLVNPHVIASSEQKVWEWEGCLSVPGLRGRIARADWVDVSYQTQQGESKQQRFAGFVARVFLHEYDHLIGLTWLDHVASTQDIMADSVWLQALEKGHI